VLGSWLIALSIICDGLDGKLARALGSSTHFGAEFDSLADFVAFGVVPGFLIWQAGLQSFGVWGAVVVSYTSWRRLAPGSVQHPQRRPGQQAPLRGPAHSLRGGHCHLVHHFTAPRGAVPHPSGWLLGLAVACMFLMVSSIEYPPLDRGFKKGGARSPCTTGAGGAYCGILVPPIRLLCHYDLLLGWGLLRHVLRLMRLYPQNRLKGTTS
jgi:CDP-diacylglycerol--serine O-phosphatidyltransferase